jgi:hypothetical protein
VPCLLAILALVFPRLVLLLIWLFTDWLATAFHTWFWPLLGFFFFPYTTLCYMWAANATNHHIEGAWVFLVVLGVLADLGSTGGSARRRRHRRNR